MSMDNVHEFVYFNPSLDNKKNITVPATTIRLGTGWLVPLSTMAMDNVHELDYFHPLMDSKKVSLFLRQRVDLELVGLCHRPIWPWTIAMNLFILTRCWTIKKNITVPATTIRLGTGWLVPSSTMAMDNVHELFYFNLLLVSKKVSSFP
jgi:hypothetical protein